MPTLQPTRADFIAFAREQAVAVGVDPNIFERQIDVESGFQPDVTSGAGAVGIAQIVPKWHPAVDPTDPWGSLRYAAGLMRSHLERYHGNYALALVHYNGGGGAVAAWQGGQPYEESQRYVNLILGSL